MPHSGTYDRTNGWESTMWARFVILGRFLSNSAQIYRESANQAPQEFDRWMSIALSCAIVSTILTVWVFSQDIVAEASEQVGELLDRMHNAPHN